MPDNIKTEKVLPFAQSIIRLLQGTVFDEDTRTWNELLTFQRQVGEYFNAIGIRLHLDEAEGFAFLTQPEPEDDTVKLPRLVRRIPLSYELTLLLVILRQNLEEFDGKALETTKCFITRTEIMDAMEMLIPEKSDRVKRMNKIDANINQAVSMGFLKEVTGPETGIEDRLFEVRRVIKAKINNEILEEIKRNIE
jgi:hypothetical protein